MAQSSNMWAVLSVLVTVAVCASATPEKNIFVATEVIKQVVEGLLGEWLPFDDQVKGAINEMCPLIQYSTEVKLLKTNESTVELQAMDILLKSVVKESCDWLASLSSVSCSVDYLSVMCAGLNLQSHATNLGALLKEKPYGNLTPQGRAYEARMWIEKTFSQDAAEVYPIIILGSDFSNCSLQDGSIQSC